MMIEMSDNRKKFGIAGVEVGKENLRIDFNHPLAGKNVIVDTELLSVK